MTRIVKFAGLLALSAMTAVLFGIVGPVDLRPETAGARGSSPDAQGPSEDAPPHRVILPERPLSRTVLPDAARRVVAEDVAGSWTLHMSVWQGDFCVEVTFADGSSGSACGSPKEVPELGLMVLADGHLDGVGGDRYLVGMGRAGLRRLTMDLADGTSKSTDALSSSGIGPVAFIMPVPKSKVTGIHGIDASGTRVTPDGGVPKDL